MTLGSRPGTPVEFLNRTGSDLLYKQVVQLRPIPYDRLKSLDTQYEALAVAPGTTPHGSLGLIGVVTSAQGVGDDEKGAAATVGGGWQALIDCSQAAVGDFVGTRVSQYDLLVAVSGQTRFRKWPRARLELTAVTISGNGISGSNVSSIISLNTTAQLSAVVNLISRNIGHLRVAYNQLLTTVRAAVETHQSVRAMYIGSGTLTGTNATGEVVLLNPPVSD